MRIRIFIIAILLSVQLYANNTLQPYINFEYNYSEEEKWKEGIAVIVCPGGSYFWHDMKTEGRDVAMWLNSNGIKAFILNYRTAQTPAFLFRYRFLFRGVRYPDAQDDLLAAIKSIKNKADEYQIDTNKIGAIGFSAGGHLVMCAATFFESSNKPFFVAPIYPVITMSGPYAHSRSRRALLGESRMYSSKWRDSLSLERHISTDCPPVFLVNCKDDPVVDYRNSILLDSALTEKRIPHKYLLYSIGGHGFGLAERKGSPECRVWKTEFLEWLKQLCNDGKEANRE